MSASVVDVQDRLRSAHVIVVGAGSLGSPVCLYLGAAGVGHIGVVDDGSVEPGDVRRQPLHFTPDAGVPKAQNAAVKLRALNPEVHVDPYPARLDEQNGEAIVMGADLVVDCTGGSGHAVNDACCAARVPLVTAGVSGLAGFALTVLPGETACLRCAGAVVPSTGMPALFGALAGVVGSIQALEALRVLSGLGSALAGALLEVDGATMEQTRVPVARHDDCESCGAVPAQAQST
jgi:adenylyltransferase/sulfurtransferase